MTRALAGACLALLLAPGPVALGQEAEESSSGEAKSREKAASEREGEKAEKDEKDEKPRVYTNEDLKTAGEGGGNVTSPVIQPHPESESDSPPASRAAEREDRRSPSRDPSESQWRARAAAARKRIADAEARVTALEEEIVVLRQDRNPTAGVLSPNREQERQARLVAAREDLEDAESEVEAAQEALEDLRREARRARVPAGWLR